MRQTNYLLLLLNFGKKFAIIFLLLIRSCVLCDAIDGDAEINFCDHNYVDAAYFNGYDIIVTRNDFLWYYYKDKHNLSEPFSQASFTQGLHTNFSYKESIIIYALIKCKKVTESVRNKL